MVMTDKKELPYGRKKFSNIDEYHTSFPVGVQNLLQQLRLAIKEAAAQATETISYNIPTFKVNKSLVYYAAYKNHIGFYPTATPLVAFKEELSAYKTSKGAIQFPLGKPLPIALIKKIVKYRLMEDKSR